MGSGRRLANLVLDHAAKKIALPDEGEVSHGASPPRSRGAPGEDEPTNQDSGDSPRGDAESPDHTAGDSPSPGKSKPSPAPTASIDAGTSLPQPSCSGVAPPTNKAL